MQIITTKRQIIKTALEKLLLHRVGMDIISDPTFLKTFLPTGQGLDAGSCKRTGTIQQSAGENTRNMVILRNDFCRFLVASTHFVWLKMLQKIGEISTHV